MHSVLQGFDSLGMCGDWGEEGTFEDGMAGAGGEAIGEGGVSEADEGRKWRGRCVQVTGLVNWVAGAAMRRVKTGRGREDGGVDKRRSGDEAEREATAPALTGWSPG